MGWFQLAAAHSEMSVIVKKDEQTYPVPAGLFKIGL